MDPLTGEEELAFPFPIPPARQRVPCDTIERSVRRAPGAEGTVMAEVLYSIFGSVGAYDMVLGGTEWNTLLLLLSL